MRLVHFAAAAVLVATAIVRMYWLLAGNRFERWRALFPVRPRDWGNLLRQVVGDDWIIGPGIKELRDHPGLGRHLLKAGREIHVWTVNTAEDLQICLDLGVTAVISDRPAYMLELLGA